MVRFTPPVLAMLAAASLVTAIPSQAPPQDDFPVKNISGDEGAKSLMAGGAPDINIIERGESALAKRAGFLPKCDVIKPGPDYLGASLVHITLCALELIQKVGAREQLIGLSKPGQWACRFEQAIVQVAAYTADGPPAEDATDTAYNVGVSLLRIAGLCPEGREGIIGSIPSMGNADLIVYVHRVDEKFDGPAPPQ